MLHVDLCGPVKIKLADSASFSESALFSIAKYYLTNVCCSRNQRKRFNFRALHITGMKGSFVHGNQITNKFLMWDHRAISHTIQAYSIFLANFVIPRINYKSQKTNKEISKLNKYLHNVRLSREDSTSHF